MIQTGRDPFARHNVVKRQVSGTCSFCGGTNRRGKVWIYFVDPDSGRKSDLPGRFCGIACCNSYHN